MTLLPGVTRGSNLGQDLGPEEVGYLHYVRQDPDGPYLIGALAWPTPQLPYHLLGLESRAHLSVELGPAKPFRPDAPLVLDEGGLLALAAYTLGAVSRSPASSDQV